MRAHLRARTLPDPEEMRQAPPPRRVTSIRKFQRITALDFQGALARNGAADPGQSLSARPLRRTFFGAGILSPGQSRSA